jgi:hypothetical protein
MPFTIITKPAGSSNKHHNPAHFAILSDVLP